MTPEQQALLDKAEDSLETAQLLQEHGKHGYAAARAYYAMFYAAEAALLQLGLAFSKHSAVISAFGEHYAKTGVLPKDLHRYLVRANEVRHLADYALSTISQDEAAEQMSRAQEFLRTVHTHLAGKDQA